MSRKIGTVKFINEKGYGFIKKAEGGEIYFHASQCGDLWKRNTEPILKGEKWLDRENGAKEEGTKVSFSIGQSIKDTEEAKDIELA